MTTLFILFSILSTTKYYSNSKSKVIEKKLQVLSSQGDQPLPRKRKHYWVQLPGQKKLYQKCHAATAGDIKKNYWWQ